jgi:hypothetical protein
MLSYANKSGAKFKKEAGAKKGQPQGKVGIGATALVTSSGRERSVFTQVPAVTLRLRGAARPLGGKAGTRSLARLLAGTGRLQRE